MKTYRAKVPLGEVCGEVITAVHGVGKIVEIYDDSLSIYLDAEDEYDLAAVVLMLSGELSGITGENISIQRPSPIYKVDNPEDAPVTDDGDAPIDPRMQKGLDTLVELRNSEHRMDHNHRELLAVLGEVVSYAEEQLRVNRGLRHVNHSLKKRLQAAKQEAE